MDDCFFFRLASLSVCDRLKEEAMTCDSDSRTPSDTRRLLAAGLNFETPSFSLDIDTEPHRSNSSFKEPLTTSSQHIEKEQPRYTIEFVVVKSDCEGEEEVGKDDFQPSQIEPQRRCKRLKRGSVSCGKRPFKSALDLQVSSVAEMDDIEDILESPTQVDRRPLRPRMYGANPILAPSTAEKVKKNIWRTPAVYFSAKAPLNFCQPATPDGLFAGDDRNVTDDFVSRSGLRGTYPDLSSPAQTPQQLGRTAAYSQRDKLVPSKLISEADRVRKTDFRNFDTKTPVRGDAVGPSQVLRTDEVSRTDENQILAFLRHRFPYCKPVDALLVDGGVDNEPVYIEYREQFASGRVGTQSGNTSKGAGPSFLAVRSIREAFSTPPPHLSPPETLIMGRKTMTAKRPPVEQNPRKSFVSARRISRPVKRGEGKWRTLNGERVYIFTGRKMTGQCAYSAYKKRGGQSKNKKRPSTTN